GLTWFEKPPLLYWVMMFGYRVLGVGEYAARLGPAICGLLTAVFLYWIGSNIDGSAVVPVRTETKGAAGSANALVGNFNRLARWSALVWLSSLGAIAFSRGAT